MASEFAAQLGAQPRNPEEDPQYLAFQRAMGVQESDARSNVALQRSMAQRNALRQIPRIQQDTQNQVQQIGLSAAARGTFGSGMRAKQQNEAQLAGDQQVGDINIGLADEQALLERELAMQIAELRRRDAEEQLAARTRLSLDAAQVGLR